MSTTCEAHLAQVIAVGGKDERKAWLLSTSTCDLMCLCGNWWSQLVISWVLHLSLSSRRAALPACLLPCLLSLASWFSGSVCLANGYLGLFCCFCSVVFVVFRLFGYFCLLDLFGLFGSVLQLYNGACASVSWWHFWWSIGWSIPIKIYRITNFFIPIIFPKTLNKIPINKTL